MTNQIEIRITLQHATKNGSDVAADFQGAIAAATAAGYTVTTARAVATIERSLGP